MERTYLTPDVEFLDMGAVVLIIFWETRQHKIVTKEDWNKIKQEAIDQSTDNP